MKTKTTTAQFLGAILLVNIFFLTSCTNSTGPKESQKLVIENGFYNKVDADNPNEIKYAIEFTYYTRGEKCNWGGYGIQMGSQGACVDLYVMQTMEPEIRYQRLDTFKVTDVLKTNPVVQTQGYRIGSSETYEELHVEYVLQPKCK